MHRILFYLLIFYNYDWICQATPLIGEQVRLAEENEFPFIVSLSFSPTSRYAKVVDKNHICGGSLITKKHVLTAAHCINEIHCYSDVVVKVGSTDLQNASTYKIKNWIDYEKWAAYYVPDYNQDGYYDVAIITLSKCVDLDITLPEITRESDCKLFNRKVMTAGWGITDNNQVSRYLKTAELKVLETDQCLFHEVSESEIIEDFISKVYFCTKAIPPVRIGCGDSGGPLLINKTEIIGVNTNCWPAGEVEKTVYRNMHARINFYKEFIASVTRKNNTDSQCVIL